MLGLFVGFTDHHSAKLLPAIFDPVKAFDLAGSQTARG
jgi:hypothetical protein